MVVSFLDFLFPSHIPCLELKKPTSQKHQQVPKKKKKKSKPTLPNQRTRKGQPNKNTKILNNDFSTFAKHHREKKLWPHPSPSQQRPSRKSRPPPHLRARTNTAPFLLGWCQKKTSGIKTFNTTRIESEAIVSPSGVLSSEQTK